MSDQVTLSVGQEATLLQVSKIEELPSVSQETCENEEFSSQTIHQPVSNIVLMTPSVTQIEELAIQTIQQVTTQIKDMEEFQQHMTDHIRKFKSVDGENYEDEYSKFEGFTKYNYEYIDYMMEKSKEILNNFKKTNDDSLEEIDRLRVLVNKASMHLPLIEKIKFRASARGIILSDFTLNTIPPEASDFYSHDEYLAEFFNNFRQEQEKEQEKKQEKNNKKI